MTVKELIERLKNCDEDSDVVVIDDNSNIVKYEGYCIEKVISVKCVDDNEITGAYIITN